MIAHDTPDGLKHQIGGQRLRVRPLDPGRVDEVRTAAGAAHRHNPEDRRPGTSSPAGWTTTLLLPELVGRLRDEGIAVNELSLHLPSLDEVFLTLTGRSTTDETTEEAA